MADPIAIATRGYITSDGFGDSITIATRGYIVTITEEGGDIIVTPPRTPGIVGMPGGFGAPTVTYSPEDIQEDDNELIILIIAVVVYLKKRKSWP